MIHRYSSLEMLNPDKLIIVKKGAEHFYIRNFLKILLYVNLYIFGFLTDTVYLHKIYMVKNL